MKNKKLTAGFVLCIVGAALILAYAAFLTFVSPFLRMGEFHGEDGIEYYMLLLHYVPCGLILLGVALTLILLSVYGKKGGRKETAGVIVVSCLAVPLLCFFFDPGPSFSSVDVEIFPPLSSLLLLLSLVGSILSLIGSILMLKALPKKKQAVGQAATDAKSEKPAETEAAQAASAAPVSEQPQPPEGAVIEVRSVGRKRRGIFRLFRKAGAAACKRAKKFRANLSKGTGSKKPAFFVLTGFFAALFLLSLACYFTDFFHYDLRFLRYYFLDFSYRLHIGGGELSLGALFSPQTWWPTLGGGLLPFEMIAMLFISALTPAYLVYLGAHNPIRLPKGYRAVLIMFGALSYVHLDLMVSSFSIVSADYFLNNATFIGMSKETGELFGYLTYLFLISTIGTQIATLFIFPYFVNDKVSSGAAIGIVIGSTLLLPLVAAIVITLVLIVVVIVLGVLFICYIITLILWLLKYTSYGSQSDGSRSQNGNTVVINDGGQELELTYVPGAIGENRSDRVYEDYAGRRYVSSDGGHTFRRM